MPKRSKSTNIFITIIISIVLVFSLFCITGMILSRKSDNISEVQARIENKEFDFEWVYKKDNFNIGVVKDKETGVEYIFTMTRDALYESITTQLTPRLNTDGTLYTGK